MTRRVVSSAKVRVLDTQTGDRSEIDYYVDLPVNDTTGRIRSCGDGTWCCEPELEVGTCDCGPAADGTFSLPDGTAQTVIGIDGPARTNTNVIPLVSPSNTPPESFPMPLSTIEESVAVTSSHSASASLPTLSSATFPSRVSLSIADISSTIYVNSLISSHAEVTLFSTSNSATSTSIAAFPTTSANPSHGSPSHTVIITASVLCGLGAGIIGTVVLLFCVRRFRCHCCCARRKPSQLSDRSSQELHDYSVPESAPAAAAVASSNNSGIADYRSQFPPSRIAGAGTVRRDQNGNIAPDHDCGNDRRQRQPQLRYPPPDSPYRSPPPHSHNEAPILGPPPPLSNSSREWNFSPPPSYSSDPPALSSSRPRGRGHRARRR